MRIFGLDIVRAVAVMLVLFGHTVDHARAPAWLSQVGRMGTLGVELFFVLSGLLIGGIIVDLIATARFETGAHLVRFWSRRWLRTVPLYYVFLFVYLWFDWHGSTRLVDHWEYLGFLQNFAWPQSPFFDHSWSLTVEEYFYLLFPLCHYLLHRVLRNPMVCLEVSVLLFITVPLMLKVHPSIHADWSPFNSRLRCETVMRLDSLMYGVAMAIVKRQYPALWRRLAAVAIFPSLLVLGIGAYCYAGAPGLMEHRVLRIVFYPMVSLSFALVLPYFDQLRHHSQSVIHNAVRYTSRVSYSLYLGHPLVLFLTHRQLGCYSGSQGFWANPVVIFPICFTGYYLLATATYYLVEQPFMNLRRGQPIE